MNASRDTIVLPSRTWRRLGHVLLWLVALGIGGQRAWHAHHAFDNPSSDPPERHRADGNSGHAEIDFGGQWVMGRMLVTGHADELYHRNRQWEVVRAAFPVENESPVTRTDHLRSPQSRVFPSPSREALRHDADWMMWWFMGEDSPEWRTLGSSLAASLAPGSFAPATVATITAARERVNPALVTELEKPRVGGPLYPPIHAFVMAPLALENDPQTAYRINQAFGLGLAYLAALGVSCLSRGRIPWSAASIAILLYPGFRSCLDLGQNSALTLNFLVWGWVLASRGRPLTGGAVWGLMAMKPTWAAAFLLVPLLTRRWRFLLGMIAVSGLLIIATLPFVGVSTWRDWTVVGREATRLYDVNENWTLLSRDLQGLPRRWLLDFRAPESERHNPTAAGIGLGLWLGVVAITAGVVLTRADRTRFVGIGPAFLFLGAYLGCFHFMYYDALLSFMAFAVLFADPDVLRRKTVLEVRTEPPDPTQSVRGRAWGYVNSFPLTVLVLLGLYENLLIASNIQSTVNLGFLTNLGLRSSELKFDVPVHLALDTLLLLTVWGWGVVRLLAQAEPRRESSAAPISGERISDSPTSTA